MIAGNEYATRKAVYDTRTFIFVGRDYFVCEKTGEVQERTSLGSFLLRWTRGECPYLCTNDASALVKDLDTQLSGVSSWTWRATPLRRVKRSTRKPKEARPLVSVHLNPLYCGFRRSNGHGVNRYFHFVDCTSLTGHTSRYHYPDQNEIESLRTFGGNYREFCRDNGIAVSSTRGKIGGSFLRDPRFFGESARRIPGFINDLARENLPGNHYELRAPTDTPLGGIYLDITGAHHNAASRTAFPNPSGLRARGKHRNPEVANSSQPWARLGTRKFDAVLRTHGLVLLRCGYRGTSKGAILHPAARTASVSRSNLVFAYTNEIELIKDSGFSIQAIEAAWTSGRTSDSLNRYAQHALDTLAKTEARDKPWVKQLLLSTYGMMGKRPTQYQSVSNVGGKPYSWPTPNGWIEGGIKQAHKEHSPATTNVIALGMIQAETRRNVIQTARYLQSCGVTILALYADSLIVDATLPESHKSKGRRGVDQLALVTTTPVQLPFLSPEWRVKTGLTNLRFINTVSWVSDEEERLPGLSREEALRESRRRSINSRSRAREVPYGPHGEESRPSGQDAPDWVMGLHDRHERGFRQLSS